MLNNYVIIISDSTLYPSIITIQTTLQFSRMIDKLLYFTAQLINFKILIVFYKTINHI